MYLFSTPFQRRDLSVIVYPKIISCLINFFRLSWERTRTLNSAAIKLHKRVLDAVQDHHRCQAQWRALINKAFYLEDVDLAEATHQLPPKWTTIATDLPTFAKFKRSGMMGGKDIVLPHSMRYAWHITLKRPLFMAFGVICAAMTCMIMWSECTFFVIHPQLSIAARILHSAARGYHYKYIQICAVFLILYLGVCAYYTIFRLRIYRYYHLDPNQMTDENSLIFSAIIDLQLMDPFYNSFTIDLQLMDPFYNSFTIDLQLMDPFYNSFTIDLQLMDPFYNSFTIDLIDLQLMDPFYNSFTIDLQLMDPFYNSFTIDLQLMDPFYNSFTIDLQLMDPFYNSFRIDLQLMDPFYNSFTIDLQLMDPFYNSFRIDLQLMDPFYNSFTIDLQLMDPFYNSFRIDLQLMDPF
ncbi:LMBR1-like membrane protein domain-containing protein [Ditylenchus destructor]|uniref:LMBR1-like membrane protein domain-containing protein n=1 Tax=Ditylenchus destructor TaxID=166010 RepID=A0AAD4N9E2_9BILA|nr:LMBR1-like membrane protein domain-containing protein [Ditylenchus destructor]